MTQPDPVSQPAADLEVLLGRARAAREAGDEHTGELFEELRERAAGPGNHAVRAGALNGLAELEHARGNSGRAMQLLHEAVACHREARDRAGEVKVLGNLGALLTDLGEYPAALQHLLEALSLVDGVPEPLVAFGVLANLARLSDLSGHAGEAREYYRRAREVARECGVRAQALISLNYGDFVRAAGDAGQAERLYREALELSGRQGPVAASALYGLGVLHAGRGEALAALAAHREGLALARASGDVDAELEALGGEAQALLLAADGARAVEVLGVAVSLAREAGRRRALQQTLALLADALHRCARHAEAFGVLREAHALERGIFSEDAERRMRTLGVQFELERARTEARFHLERLEGERLAKERAERELLARTRELEHLALHDELTGLPNRLLFRERLERALEAAAAGGAGLAVGLIDLNGFKFVNDSLGHSAGDALLREVARRIAPALREQDTLARMGGDEFLVLVTSVTHPEAVERVARRLCAAFEAPFAVDAEEVFVSPSMGFALHPEHAGSAELLLQRADQAMYAAKGRGSGFEIYREDEVGRHAPVSLESALYRALQREEFELHYQALSAPDGGWLGAEALLRWEHPQFGRVSPAEFVPIAERSGLIVPLGAWVLRQACREAACWAGELSVAVNLSARQFTQAQLVDHVREALSVSGLAPRRLELELTESLLVQHPETARRILGQLKDLGVRVVIDDFGTGHSSLAQLKRFPIDGLKVDRGFIQDLGRGAAGANQDEAIVTAIVRMGHALGLSVTVEGVETEAQRAFLASLNVTALQGFLLARPEPAARFRSRLPAG